MKPTQVKCAPGGLNQIPPDATVSGDIRLTPFYDVDALKASIEAEVAAINADIEALPTRGPCSKYVITPPGGGRPIVGNIKLEWGDHLLTGIACDLTSPCIRLDVRSHRRGEGQGGAVLAHRVAASRARDAVGGIRYSAYWLR